jgi:hypothetical protein
LTRRTRIVARRVSVVFGLLVVLILIGFQLQHLLWSTARVNNGSVHVLSELMVRVDDATIFIGNLSPGDSRFVRLPQRGEATFSVEFSSGERKYKACAEYVEGAMYHVRVDIAANSTVSCETQLGVLTRRIMLLELW